MEDITQLDTAILIDMMAEHTKELVSMMSGRVTHEEYILKQNLIKRLQNEINKRTASRKAEVQSNPGG